MINESEKLPRRWTSYSLIYMLLIEYLFASEIFSPKSKLDRSIVLSENPSAPNKARNPTTALSYSPKLSIDKYRLWLTIAAWILAKSSKILANQGKSYIIRVHRTFSPSSRRLLMAVIHSVCVYKLPGKPDVIRPPLSSSRRWRNSKSSFKSVEKLSSRSTWKLARVSRGRSTQRENFFSSRRRVNVTRVRHLETSSRYHACDCVSLIRNSALSVLYFGWKMTFSCF